VPGSKQSGEANAAEQLYIDKRETAVVCCAFSRFLACTRAFEHTSICALAAGQQCATISRLRTVKYIVTPVARQGRAST